MADYAKAASDLKARLDAKYKRIADLNDFFESVRSAITTEVASANAELSARKAPTIAIREEATGEPTIQLACMNALCKIAQNRDVPSISAVITGEAGETTLTFIIQIDQSPVTAQQVSLAPAAEPRLSPAEIAARFVEALIAGAP
jgi:hypothetical protein